MSSKKNTLRSFLSALKKTLTSKKVMSSLPKALSFIVLMLFISNASLGQESEKWDYSTAVYAWMPGIDGTVGALGQTVDAEASFSDLISNTKFGVMAGIRAEKGRLAISGDFIYVRLGEEEELPPVEVDINPLMIEGHLGYEVLKDLEVFGGARIVSVENKIQLHAPVPILVEATKTWVDPMVGIRFAPKLTERWAVITRADIGGFGAGSEFSYQFQGYAVLNLTEKASLAFGYRLLDIDYQEDANAQFLLDMQIKGPTVGFIYKF